MSNGDGGRPVDPWWPEGYELPAFRVQRERYGSAQGGDYTRGSAWSKGVLAGADTELPATPEFADTWTLGDPVPTAAPAFGAIAAAPGHAIRWDGTTWINLGPVRDVPQTAVRYPSTVPGYDLVAGRATLFVRPFDHTTAQITWNWPDSLGQTWDEVALVRSAFGLPSTVNDGVTLFWSPIEKFFSDRDNETTGLPIMVRPPVMYDRPLTGDKWYYYSLFFKTGLDWVLGMTDTVLIPADHHHAEHLFNAIPPYYQYLDDNITVGAGPLRQFLRIFGFELDLTRAYIDSYQQMYHFDLSPMALLKQAGNNIGVPYEAGLGDIRYRSLMGELGKLYEIRGTAEGLERMCEAASKYECDVTGGRNLLPLPDDSDPYWSIGHWGVVHADTWANADMTPLVLPLDFSSVRVYLPSEGYPAGPLASYPITPPVVVPSPPGARGVLRVESIRSAADATANDTKPLYIGIGDTIQWVAGQDPFLAANQKEVIPLYAGVPVQEGRTYGFSLYVKTTQPLAQPAVVTLIFQWIGYSGQPEDVVDTTLGGPAAVTQNNDWELRELQAVAPAGAFYLVPTIYISGRTAAGAGWFSYAVDLGTISLYDFGGEEGGAALPPDRYLTVGDPNKKIGLPDTPEAPPDFEGYLLGGPIEDQL